MARREQNPTGKGSVDNKTAWKHIVQAWNLVKPESIRHCFRHVPIFNERQKALLSTSQEGERVVEQAFAQIQFSIDQMNDKSVRATGSNDSEVQKAVDENQRLVLSSRESLALWSAVVPEEDRTALQNRSETLPVLPAMDISGSISTEESSTEDSAGSSDQQQPPASLPLYGMENFEDLSQADKDELLSHADTHQMHFSRLSSGLDCRHIVEPGIEELKNNPAFSHFFKPKSVHSGAVPKQILMTQSLKAMMIQTILISIIQFLRMSRS
ncbi:hypothetical protein BGZ65_012319 [Modicella reniformis]|uniref:Uncharacterized protein n=1 Tax=Modicella reniformis TaxID=1440133 RepID=A0A9P6MD35_9FUNG|nr:hypothetical protein BGZ65_012319 [Modicella reniformis]